MGKKHKFCGVVITEWLEPEETYMASAGFCGCGEPFPKQPKSNHTWIVELKKQLMRETRRTSNIETNAKGFERLVYAGKKMKRALRIKKK